MLKHEVAQEMTTEQYGTFITTTVPVAHALPDGRLVKWYNEVDVHEFLVAWEATHPIKEENNGVIEPETVPVQPRDVLTGNEDNCVGPRVQVSGT